METTRISFETFLLSAFAQGDYSTDDAIAFVLPLYRKALGFHEAGLVAPFDRADASYVTEMALDMEEALAHAPSAALYRIDTGEADYIRGYRCYELLVEHHDPLGPLHESHFAGGNERFRAGARIADHERAGHGDCSKGHIKRAAD